MDINASNKLHIKQALGETIDKLLVKLNTDLKESNRAEVKKYAWYDKQKWEAEFKRKLTNAILDIEVFRKKVPEYVDIIIEYLNKPEVKNELRELVKEKLKELTDSTVANIDMKTYNETLQKYGVRDRLELNRFMEDEFKA